jgi:PAS domain-containing protein
MNRDGIWDFNLARDEIHLSPGWYRLLGLPVREEPLPWTGFYERLHPEDQEETDGLDREGLTGERPLSLECRFRTVRGNWHRLLVRSRLADRLRQALSDVMASPDQPVTASFGVARWKEGLSLFDLFERAHRAMGRAKRLGKDPVMGWSVLKGAPGRSE